MENLENTIPIRRLRSMLPKFEAKSNLEIWWLGYCDGGNWPAYVFRAGTEIIQSHFKK